MKKIVITIITFISIAYSADNNTYIKKLTLSLPKKEINKDSTIEAKVLATYSNNSTKELTKNIEWVVSKKDALKTDNTKLTAIKDYPKPISIEAKVKNSLNKIVTSNKESLKIYWEVDGHRLPPEPDPKVNNATLLGVDVNENGVRDDVERWIYTRYKEYIPCDYIPDRNVTMPDGTIMPTVKKVCAKHPIPYHPVVRAVAMQGARAAQIIIQHPEKARETTKIFDDAQNCSWYLFDLSKKKNDSSIGVEDILIHEFDNMQYNTTLRARAYAKYNYYLSGGVYELPKDEELIKGCDNKIKQMIKDLK